jgi:hypothetical protein
MKLPNNSIGISDIINYRECPQRMAFNMRRHIELPERLQLEPGERDEPPGHTNWTNAYGSAIHDAMHLVDKEGLTHEQAIHEVMLRWGTYLDPGDIDQLRDDLSLFEKRRPLGVTLVGSEMEARVPLFAHETEGQIYFRFRIDALHRLIANPGIFLHRDYKSSKWRKSPAEVHSDPQMWSYNWGIHEWFPECQFLQQTYDQLRFGEVPTSKNDAQRATIKQWLIENVRVIMADETYKPKQNDFCRYCPLVVTCRETQRATDYWKGRLALTAPLTKEGRKVRVAFEAEGEELARVVREELPKMSGTRKHIEHVEKVLKTMLAEMSIEQRQELGWQLKDRRSKTIPPDGLRELHAMMGDTFYQLVNMSMSTLEEHTGKPKKGEPVPAELEVARNWQTEEVTGTNLVPANSED